MNAWDCLAGLLLVREAGGQTGSIPDSAEAIFRGIPVLAAAPGIADKLARATGILASTPLPATAEKSPTVRYPARRSV
jgi:myo-inositol-1(or 4)-monophosphatase